MKLHRATDPKKEKISKRIKSTKMSQSVPLSSQQIDVLDKASKNGFDVNVLHKTTGGRTRCVVLLGETHIQGPTVHRAGADVARRFNEIGVEKARNIRGVGPRALTSIVGCLYPTIRCLFRLQGSTIQVALQAAREANGPRVFHLESERAADLVEDLSYGLIALCFCSIFGTIVSLVPALIFNRNLRELQALSAVNCLVIRLMTLPLLTWRRDPDMVKNALRESARSAEPALLCIMGMGHLAGVSAGLSARGFLPVALRDLQRGSEDGQQKPRRTDIRASTATTSRQT